MMPRKANSKKFVIKRQCTHEVMGMRGSAIRGDFLLYIMSGIFLFMTHTKAMGAVVASEGPASPMMNHAPMNTFISICASALSALYLQVLSLFVILFVYHVMFKPLEIGLMGEFYTRKNASISWGATR